jgi:hypothetical protein
MRSKDQIVLENLYNNILENTNTDSEYVELEKKAKSGDESSKKQVQKLVNEKRVKMGYDTFAYHATDNDFKVFDIEKSKDVGFHFGTEEQAKYKNRSRTLSVYLLIKNPVILADNSWDDAETIHNALNGIGIASKNLDSLRDQFKFEENQSSWKSDAAKTFSRKAFKT